MGARLPAWGAFHTFLTPIHEEIQASPEANGLLIPEFRKPERHSVCDKPEDTL